MENIRVVFNAFLQSRFHMFYLAYFGKTKEYRSALGEFFADDAFIGGNAIFIFRLHEQWFLFDLERSLCALHREFFLGEHRRRVCGKRRRSECVYESSRGTAVVMRRFQRGPHK